MTSTLLLLLRGVFEPYRGFRRLEADPGMGPIAERLVNAGSATAQRNPRLARLHLRKRVGNAVLVHQFDNSLRVFHAIGAVGTDRDLYFCHSSLQRPQMMTRTDLPSGCVQLTALESTALESTHDDTREEDIRDDAPEDSRWLPRWGSPASPSLACWGKRAASTSRSNSSARSWLVWAESTRAWAASPMARNWS